MTRLPSGRRVVTDRMPGAASVAVLALVEVGGRDEEPALAGASHFLEHLLCKGSRDRAALDVAEEVDCRGGDLDAVTDRERTAVQVRVPAGDGDFALQLLGDLVLRPALRVDEIEIERRVILEELAQAEEDPEDRAHTLAAAALYPDHPLGREVIGDRSTLASMGRAQIATFHGQRYVPHAMVIVAAGAVDHDRVVETVESWDALEERREMAAATPSRVAPVPGSPVTRVLRRPGEQVHLVTGWRLGTVDDADRPALAVAAHVLGGGPASRLYRAVRDERGLSYAVDASVALHSDAGTVSTYAGCSPGAVAEVRSLIADEAARLATDGPTDREVEVATGYLAGSSTLALEDSGIRAWRAAIEELERGGVKPAAERIEAYRRVTAADVTKVLADLVGPPTVVAVGPVSRRARL